MRNSPHDHDEGVQALLLADGRVGAQIAHWLFVNHRSDIALAVTTSKNRIFDQGCALGIPTSVFSSTDQLLLDIDKLNRKVDIGILAWWPRLIERSLLAIPTRGFVNTHPSLLPYNRGKHYNFWALVEEAPFGVTLHFADEGIDSGDIVAQMPIKYDWEDTGGTLYEKAANAMVALFKETYPDLRANTITRRRQDLSQGSFHLSSEMDQASVIELDKVYRARDLLNLIRARTFPGYRACCFKEESDEYEVRIDIRRKGDASTQAVSE